MIHKFHVTNYLSFYQNTTQNKNWQWKPCFSVFFWQILAPGFPTNARMVMKLCQLLKVNLIRTIYDDEHYYIIFEKASKIIFLSPFWKKMMKVYPWRCCYSLYKKCPNMEFFLVRIFLYSVQIQERRDQRKLRFWTLFTQLLVKIWLHFWWRFQSKIQNIYVDF